MSNVKNIKTILISILICFLFCGYLYAEPGGPVEKEEFPFKLLATVLESDSNRSFAVIRQSGSNTPGKVKVLDKIAGYQIVKIRRGRVTLLKNGRFYFLEFTLGNDFTPVEKISTNERIINRDALSKEMSNLDKGFSQFLPIPHIESGKIMGFKITKLKNKDLADMAGLREGDLAIKVNGQSLDSLKKVLALYPKIRNQEKIDLEIKRGDETKKLTYYIY